MCDVYSVASLRFCCSSCDVVIRCHFQSVWIFSDSSDVTLERSLSMRGIHLFTLSPLNELHVLMQSLHPKSNTKLQCKVQVKEFKWNPYCLQSCFFLLLLPLMENKSTCLSPIESSDFSKFFNGQKILWMDLRVRRKWWDDVWCESHFY